MAQLYSEDIKAHKSIYAVEPRERMIHIEYAIPDAGVDPATGILVVVPGFGGSAMSNVHRHIREDFPDRYNLIVIHCNYFGIRFMDSFIDSRAQELADNPSIVEGQIWWKTEMGEDEDEFNDMGIMQAVDVINSLFYVMKKYATDGIDAGRIILFGNSHGAYVSHLANAFCPDLFSYLIDVSAYITPYYLNNQRELSIMPADSLVQIFQVYRYLVFEEGACCDEKLQDLRFLYSNFNNRCKIIALHGADDQMVDCSDKKNFIDSLDNADILVFEEKDVDGDVVFNSGHGLGLDFLKLLDMYLGIILKNDRPQKNRELFTSLSIEGMLESVFDNDGLRLTFVKDAKEWGERIHSLKKQ